MMFKFRVLNSYPTFWFPDIWLRPLSIRPPQSHFDRSSESKECTSQMWETLSHSHDSALYIVLGLGWTMAEFSLELSHQQQALGGAMSSGVRCECGDRDQESAQPALSTWFWNRWLLALQTPFAFSQIWNEGAVLVSFLLLWSKVLGEEEVYYFSPSHNEVTVAGAHAPGPSQPQSRAERNEPAQVACLLSTFLLC